MGWTKKQLVSTCSRLRDHILARELAGEDELLDYWPTDCGCAASRTKTCPKCRSRPKHDWYMTHSQLVRMNGRDEWRRGVRSEDADRELLQQLNQEPRTLVLLSGEEIKLWPKGYRALKFIQDRDWLCAWLAGLEQMIQTQVEEMRLTRDELKEPISTIDTISEEIARQMAVIINVVTQPGPDFGPLVTDEGEPDWQALNNPPAWILELSPIDVARINREFFRLQLPQLNLVPYLMGPQKPKKEGGRRYGWSVFYTRAGQSLNVDATLLMRNRSLASLLIDMHLRAADMAEFQPKKKK